MDILPHADSAVNAYTGAETLEFLPEAFVLISAHNAPGNSPGKRPIGRDWQNSPKSKKQAIAHLKRGGNIGLLTGDHAGKLCLIDLDGECDLFFSMFPDLAGTARFIRENAPERAKLLIQLDGELPKSRKTDRIEFLANGRQGVVAGRHETGAEIKFIPGKIPVLSPLQLADLWFCWTGELFESTRAAPPAPPLPIETLSASGNGSGNLASLDEIFDEELYKNPNRNEGLYRLIQQLKGQGGDFSDCKNYALKYQALRENEKDHKFTIREALYTLESAYNSMKNFEPRVKSRSNGNGNHPEPDYIPEPPEPPESWQEPEHKTEPGAAKPEHKTEPVNRVLSWQPLTLADAYKEREPVEFVVPKKEIFELPSLNAVFGPPGCLKSFFLAHLAICVAGGVENWLEPLPGETAETVKVNPFPVMWVDFDNGKRRTLDRSKALGKTYNLPADIPLYLFAMPNPLLDLGNPEMVADLADLVTRHNARLVFIDNLGSTTPNDDENSDGMAKVMSNLRVMAERTGAAIVIIHHQRKSAGKGIDKSIRSGERLRGHGSIESALDLALMVEREPQTGNITIQATKTRGVDVLPFSAIFTFEKGTAGELQTAKFFSKSTVDPTSVKAIMTAILEVLGEEQMTKTKLAEESRKELKELGIGINRIRDAITMLISNGEIIEERGERTTIYLQRAEQPI